MDSKNTCLDQRSQTTIPDRHFRLYAFFAILASACALLPHLAHSAAPHSAQVPHNAFDKAAREDLLAPLQTQGEVRVIVGLQTPQEIAQPLDVTPDQVKEARVTARQSRVLQRLAGHNVRNLKRLRHHHFMALTADADTLIALLNDPEITSITVDRPNYPVLNETPGITRATNAWTAGYRGAGQTVAILDTGVDRTHPFFSGKVVAEACFSRPVGSNTSFCPSGVSPSVGAGTGVQCSRSDLGCWHGTHVAGIAAGRTGVLSAATGGIAPDASLIAIQVFQLQCSGSTCSITAYDSDLLAALDHVYSLRNTHNIASVNMSLGGDVYTAQCDSSLPAYKTIITNLRNANIATIIASGNNGNAGAISAPACVSNAISVGATTKSNTIASYSNSASFLSLLAPGSSITSSIPGGGFGGASGTSMATPHVAGAWGVLKQAKPTATVTEVLTALQSTGLPITDTRNGIVKQLIQIGNTTSSAGAIGVLTGQPPTVTLTSPANNARLTAPAAVSLSATAADPDGSVSKVEFYRDATLIATVTAPTSGASTYSTSDPNVPVGTYSYTAKAYDNASPAAVTTSTAALVSVTAISAAAVNVAAQANGGVASASSVYDGRFPVSGANNGDRKGSAWGNGGGWNDATANTFPDWLQVNFSSTQSISEINVFTVQDNFPSPAEPTPSMTFTQYGVTAFQVQYWNGSAWLDVPGGNVTGNNLVWRKFTFAPINTNAIRVLVNSALNTYARITEIEAWTGASPMNVAAQANGGVASASSVYDSRFPASGTINGDRKGQNWGNGGGWNDATPNAYPDWLQVNFSGTQNISEISVFTVQDNYPSPAEPTPSMTFTQYGLTAFQVQYWNGSAWLSVPGGNVTGNNLVWRKFSFAPVSTNAIRVLVDSALNTYARITEIEAWTGASAGP